jgi:hypothetical protein
MNAIDGGARRRSAMDTDVDRNPLNASDARYRTDGRRRDGLTRRTGR